MEQEKMTIDALRHEILFSLCLMYEVSATIHSGSQTTN